MVELKWMGNQIVDFLNIFQNYLCLWDVSSKEYLIKIVKEENLQEAGMFYLLLVLLITCFYSISILFSTFTWTHRGHTDQN